MERFGGAPVGGLRRTTPIWPPILPSDREADARVGVQLVNAKVRSRRSVAADLGEEDPDAEMSRIVEEARELAALLGDGSRGRPEGTRDGDDGAADPGGDRTEEGASDEGDAEGEGEAEAGGRREARAKAEGAKAGAAGKRSGRRG
jgi:hypothetical protein